MANPAQIPLVNEHLPLLRGALILRGHLWGPLCRVSGGLRCEVDPERGTAGAAS